MIKNTIQRSLLLGLIFCTCTIQAQNVPGYLGSRLSIGYSLQFTPNFFLGNFNSPGDPVNADDFNNPEKLFYGFSTVHSLSTEYVLSKKLSVTANVGFSRAYYLPPNFRFGNAGNASYDSRPGLTSIPIVVGARWYLQQLAPLGSFFELNLGYQIINPDDFTYSGTFYSNVSNSNVEVVEETITPNTTGALLAGLKFGKSRVFFDKLKVDFYAGFSLQYKGMGSSYTAIGNVLEELSDDFNDNENPYILGNVEVTQNGFEDKARGRMFGSFYGFSGVTFSFLP